MSKSWFRRHPAITSASVFLCTSSIWNLEEHLVVLTPWALYGIGKAIHNYWLRRSIRRNFAKNFAKINFSLDTSQKRRILSQSPPERLKEHV